MEGTSMNDLDLSGFGLEDDIQAQAMVAGEVAPAEKDSLGGVHGRILTLQDAMTNGSIPSHLMKASRATLAMLNAVALEKSGIAPNGSSYEQHYAISETQALADAEHLRSQGFADVATDMETAIKNSNADDIELASKHAQLLQDSHKQLAQMKADDIKKIKDSEARLERERSLDLLKARG